MAVSKALLVLLLAHLGYFMFNYTNILAHLSRLSRCRTSGQIEEMDKAKAAVSNLSGGRGAHDTV
jgi:hypothetical protein